MTVVNINDEFPSKWLKSGDLQGAAVRVKIASVESEQLGNDRKLVMYFTGKQKGMVLNKTNAKTIADSFGDETDNWIGAEIEVFAMKVDMQGKMVDGLRVRIPRQAPARASVAPNARERAMASANEAPPPVAAYDDGLDDEIPF
jgi:hypothetical protein